MIQEESARQYKTLALIASENLSYTNVAQCLGVSAFNVPSPQAQEAERLC